jgi:(S)-ureidoglycine aminohydrolase
MQHLGSTRTTVRPNYTLLTPDSFVRAPLPGMERATAIVHAAPALGAAFTQYTAEFERSGKLGPNADRQRFVYVLDGELQLETKAKSVRLLKGCFAFLPAGLEHRLAAKTKARAAVIEKPYQPLEGLPAPKLLTGKERSVQPQPLGGDPAVLVRSLIPADASFDLAVNTMTYAPGSTLPMVEAHVMEHGLLMLDGGGIYRLDNDWHPTTAGDFIWMGPYCPQWFGALGKAPARYLIYKDWNRHPHA